MKKYDKDVHEVIRIVNAHAERCLEAQEAQPLTREEAEELLELIELRHHAEAVPCHSRSGAREAISLAADLLQIIVFGAFIAFLAWGFILVAG